MTAMKTCALLLLLLVGPCVAATRGSRKVAGPLRPTSADEDQTGMSRRLMMHKSKAKKGNPPPPQPASTQADTTPVVGGRGNFNLSGVKGREQPAPAQEDLSVVAWSSSNQQSSGFDLDLPSSNQGQSTSSAQDGWNMLGSLGSSTSSIQTVPGTLSLISSGTGPAPRPPPPPPPPPSLPPTPQPIVPPTPPPTVPPTPPPTVPPTPSPTEPPPVATTAPTPGPTMPPSSSPTSSPVSSTDSPTTGETDSPTDATTSEPTESPTGLEDATTQPPVSEIEVETTEAPTSPSSARTAAPTEPAPTATPTESMKPSMDLAEAWVALIQSRSPPTVFEDDSPQLLALEWMISDATTRWLADDEDRVLQRFALATFWFATGGPFTWDHRDEWVTLDPECEWSNDDITCSDDMVVEIYLRDDGLSGEIPVEVALLTALTALYVHENDLEGKIPSEFGLMTDALQVIWLDTNNISGEIPTEVFQLPNLLSFDVFANNMTGTIPTEIGLLAGTNFTELSLAENLFNGPIPTEMAGLSELEFLYMYDTDLTGSVPTSLCPPEGSLTDAWIDCEDVECDCCSFNDTVPCFNATETDERRFRF